jgi:hypothetical protein
VKPAAAIGKAPAPVRSSHDERPHSQSPLFALDNGTDSTIDRWQELFGDQSVQATELTLTPYLTGTAQLATTHFPMA